MRIDKAKHREISARQLQRQVTYLYRQGLGKEAIEQALERVQADIGEGEKVTSCILPRVVVEPSHLDKGFVAFFICPPCQRKVRTVYFLDMRIACRACHGLTYKKQDRRKGIVNRLIWDDRLRNEYLNYEWGRRYRLAMEAKLAREEIQRRGYEVADGLIQKAAELKISA